MGNVEVEGPLDALQATLFRENSGGQRTGKVDRAEAFSIARLEKEGGTAKGAAALPGKPAKGSSIWRARQSLRG